MPQLGLGLSLDTGRFIGSVSPIPSTGLLSWLKADTGVMTSTIPYTNQIVLSGQSSVNGTYTRAVGYNDFTTFTNGTKRIQWDYTIGKWMLFDSTASFPPKYMGTNGYYPTSFSPYTTTNSFVVSGLGSPLDGTYTSSSVSSFSKAGGTAQMYHDGTKWTIKEYGCPLISHTLTAPATSIITTTGWTRQDTDRITINGGTGFVANGTYKWLGNYEGTNEDTGEQFNPLLETGTNNGWRVNGNYLEQATYSGWNASFQTSNNGASWQSNLPIPFQFTISGVTGSYATELNRTYTYSFYDSDNNMWNYSGGTYTNLYFDGGTWEVWDYSQGMQGVKLLSKTGASPVGTWTQYNGVTGTATGSNSTAFSVTGTKPTISVSSVTTSSGASPAPTITASGGTLSSAKTITGISVNTGSPDFDGSYTRTGEGRTTFTKVGGGSPIYWNYTNSRWEHDAGFFSDQLPQFYDADYNYYTGSVTETPSSNLGVATWADTSSGTGAILTAVNPPQFIPSGINSKPVIRMAQASMADGKYMYGNIGVSLNASHSIFVVAKNSDASYGCLLSQGVETIALNKSGTTLSVDALQYDNIHSLSTLPSSGTPYIISSIAQNIDDSPSNYWIYINGIGTPVGTPKSYEGFYNSSALLILGSDDSNSVFCGDIAEVIIYSSALSVAQRQQVEAYLNAKYGIY
jgi:hypothetical protein